MDIPINTYLFQKEKPNSKVETDHLGKPIIVGKRVAFNRSGDVEFGTIISFSYNWRARTEHGNRKDPEGRKHWCLNFALTLKRDNGEESVVKNPRSFLILD